MQLSVICALVALAPLARAVVIVKNAQEEKACAAEDLKHRMLLQNKLAGACEDMCKEVGAFPKCDCPAFVAPDKTPGVVTWPELLEYMDHLAQWGHDIIRKWKGVASALQKSMQVTFTSIHAGVAQGSKACTDEDLKHRTQLQNKIAGECEDMCKEVGAYPKCSECPAFVEPDSTPGVVTWPELLAHMDNLVEWAGPRGLLKAWSQRAASVLQKSSKNQTVGSTVGVAKSKRGNTVTFVGSRANATVTVACGECKTYPSSEYYPSVEICDSTGTYTFHNEENCDSSSMKLTLYGGALCVTGTPPNPVYRIKHFGCSS